MPERAYLTIFGEGEVEVDLVSRFLIDLQICYNALVAFETFTEPARFESSINPLFRTRQLRSGYQISWNLPAVLRDQGEWGALVTPSERLILSSVNIASPGFWKFLGTLNPLEVIRKYLCDRHERRKDREYRERAEERRLHLENVALENKIIKQRIDILRETGLSKKEIAPLMNRLVYSPLSKLGDYQDKGLIDGARLDGMRFDEPNGDSEG